jgi:hypothetical protein
MLDFRRNTPKRLERRRSPLAVDNAADFVERWLAAPELRRPRMLPVRPRMLPERPAKLLARWRNRESFFCSASVSVWKVSSTTFESLRAAFGLAYESSSVSPPSDLKEVSPLSFSFCGGGLDLEGAGEPPRVAALGAAGMVDLRARRAHS